MTMLSQITASGGGAPATYIEDVFSTYLWTGTGATLSIVNNIDLATKGGLTWIKQRGQASAHALFDTARGATNRLATNGTNAQATVSGVTAFNTNGFTSGTDAETNGSGNTYVGWTFRKQPKFFDVVTWTGDGTTSKSISHNLGSVPGCIITKGVDVTDGWYTYHRSYGYQYKTRLESTAAQSAAGVVWGSADPTSTQFTVGYSVGDGGANQSGKTYVAYIFAHDAGGFGLTGTDNVISCGSYTGNGSTSGPTVTLGYEPQWVMVKNTSATGYWYMLDSMRGMSLTASNELAANNSAAENGLYGGTAQLAPQATGFQIINSGTQFNTSGQTYIYIAIRRGPMKVPTDGTTVFTPAVRTGTNTLGQTITNANFPVDLIIGRNRASAAAAFVDRLRGITYLRSDNTDAEASATNYLSSLAAQSGWVSSTGGSGFWNTSPNSYIQWYFKRAPSFFDEVCYTGTGASAAITHNLGVAPELSIIKSRSLGVEHWNVWQTDLGTSSPGNYYYLQLDATTAKQASNDRVSTVTSTVVNIGNNDEVNKLSSTYVMYLFATCAGVSKVGSYTGTGTTQQINCGFTAGSRFVLIKRTDSTGDWYVYDSARGIVAGNDPYLLLNTSDAEVTSTDYVDTYAAGFELSSTAPAALNASGGSYIFLAIA